MRNDVLASSSSSSSSSTTTLRAEAFRPEEDHAKKVMLQNPVMTWQSDVDLPTRRVMMQRLMLIMHNKQALTLERPVSQESWLAKLPSIVRRVELALYIRAASVEEYLNVSTLKRRVQFLILTLHHQSAVARFAAKRKRCGSEDTTQHPMRLQRILHFDPVVTRTTIVDVERHSAGSDFILDQQPDLIRHIFGFLDGKEVVRCYPLNRFAARFLPVCVRNLSLSLETLRDILASELKMKTFGGLEELKVVNRNCNPNESRYCSKLPFYAPNHGEVIVRDLAAALRYGSHSKLRKLVLSSTFINTAHTNGAGALLEALADGACPALEVLAIGGIGLGDTGASSLSKALLSNHFRRLQQLDVRGNYIGERGFESIASAIEAGHVPNLSLLSMGCNLASDIALGFMCRALSRGSLNRLTFMGFEDNFIEAAGITSLAQVLKTSVCPALRELCIGDNSIDNSSIHRIFCQVMQ